MTVNSKCLYYIVSDKNKKLFHLQRSQFHYNTNYKIVRNSLPKFNDPLFHEAFLFNSYEVCCHADSKLIVIKTKICEICSGVKKSASKVSVAKIKRLHIPAKAKAPVSLTSPDRIKLTLHDEKLKSAHPLTNIYDMAI